MKTFCKRSQTVSLTALSSDFILQSASPDTQVYAAPLSHCYPNIGLVSEALICPNRSRGITAEGELRHTNFDVEKSHLRTPKQIYQQRTEYTGFNLSCNPPSVVIDLLHIFSDP